MARPTACGVVNALSFSRLERRCTSTVRCEMDRNIADILLRFTCRDPLKDLGFARGQSRVVQRTGQFI